ncbi:TonB-dependent receptor [Aquincola sp. S2]|uniref:TonB-dependent receptor n=1 Tax=Pseudaquabacterium terrae TaxID=2732868 RepID=A0ABX2ELZ2_9BURK|nr:TonB-dependent receptor [Aquabacterium terrae]NRF69613.1 TonB-dependent receptor [Aquabacterium terrae]
MSMPRAVPLFAACMLAALAASPAHAAVDEEGLEQVYGDRSTISIATGRRQPIQRAPAVATVITADDIAALGATDLDEVLATVPGLHVGRGHIELMALYLIRGIYHRINPQTLVLLNGMPMTTLFVGNRGLAWSSFALDDIARIEVIRGPGSALYGADAYAGVINLITKSAAEHDGHEAGLRVGSFGRREGYWQYGGRRGPLDVAAYLHLGRSDGPRNRIEADAQTALDALFGTRASLAPGPISNGHEAVDARLELAHERWRLRTAWMLRDKVGAGAGVAEALDPVGVIRTDHRFAELSLTEQPLGPDWRLNLGVGWHGYSQYHHRPLQLFPPGAFGGSFPNGMFGAPNTWERQWRLSAALVYTGLARHRLRIGVGFDDLDLYRTQEFKNFNIITSGPAAGLPVPIGDGSTVVSASPGDIFLLPQHRTVRYAYLQDEWDLAKDWSLTAGVRHDRFSDAGHTTNPRAGLVWHADYELTAKLLYGHAFRAPAFNEQHSINNPVERGNPALKPETIRTLEAVLAWQGGSWQGQLSVFRHRMRDIIRAVPDVASVGSSYQNTGAQRGRGLEAEFRWDVTRELRLAGHAAWQRSTDEATGRDPGYAPRRLLNLRADWTLPQAWQLGMQVREVAGRRRPPGDARAPLADYTNWDAHLRSPAFAGGWRVMLAVNNVFDADRREPSTAPGVSLPNDIPLPGRAAVLQASWRF